MTTVEVFEDSTYTAGSADNVHQHRHVYSEKGHIRTKIAVALKGIDGEVTNSAILCFEGFSGADEKSYAVLGDQIVILAGKYLVSLGREDLGLGWKIEADPSCCFAIAVTDSHIVVHGEQIVSCFDFDGNKEWEITARDIFASPIGKECFSVQAGKVYLVDFENYHYVLDISGKLLSDRKNKFG